jgi:hypothetical protein
LAAGHIHSDRHPARAGPGPQLGQFTGAACAPCLGDYGRFPGDGLPESFARGVDERGYDRAAEVELPASAELMSECQVVAIWFLPCQVCRHPGTLPGRVPSGSRADEMRSLSGEKLATGRAEREGAMTSIRAGKS